VRILACDLGALDTAQRARHSALRAELGARRLGVREVADGGPDVKKFVRSQLA
jgi:hypothetical protein